MSTPTIDNIIRERDEALAVISCARAVQLQHESLKQLGPSHDRAVERDLFAAIDRLCEALAALEEGDA